MTLLINVKQIKIQKTVNKMKEKKIALIGLGYVGLPLAIEFGKKREVIGFDINKDRISQLERGG